ncbi:MAG: CBS domain-containing protein, partial [Dehalococcoidia bacterium]
GADPDGVRVADLMTEVPATIGPDESVGEAARLMAERQIRRLPVTEGTRLVGILSLGDIAADGAEQPAGAALHDISEPAKPNR